MRQMFCRSQRGTIIRNVEKGEQGMTERIYERENDTLLKPKEKIIRCKECKYRELKDFVYGTCKYRIGTVKPDGFCERGERK